MAEVTTTDPSADPSTGTPSEWTEKRRADFWTAMTHLYGSRWKQEYGAEMSEGWRLTLDSMTRREAGLGFKACRDSGDCRPCTLPMFVKRVSDALAAEKPVAPPYRALPGPSRQGGKEGIELVKAELRKRGLGVLIGSGGKQT